LEAEEMETAPEEPIMVRREQDEVQLMVPE